MRDLAAAVPLRFTDAFRAEEIDREHYQLGCYVAALCFEARNKSGGVATVRLADLAGLFRCEVEHVRRKLRDLDPAWIECKTRSGPNAVWRIRLTGLAWRTEDGDGSPPNLHSISTENTSAEWKSISTKPEPLEAETALPEPDSPQSESPLHDSAPTSTRHDTTRDTACSEGTVEPLAVSRPLETAVAVADDDDLPEPGSPEVVFALLRRYRPGHPARARLLGLQRDMPKPGPRLETEIGAFLAEGLLVPEKEIGASTLRPLAVKERRHGDPPLGDCRDCGRRCYPDSRDPGSFQCVSCRVAEADASTSGGRRRAGA